MVGRFVGEEVVGRLVGDEVTPRTGGAVGTAVPRVGDCDGAEVAVGEEEGADVGREGDGVGSDVGERVGTRVAGTDGGKVVVTDGEDDG